MIVLKQSEFIPMNNNLIYDFYYKVFNDDKCIGYACISINSNNMLYMFIDNKYRGFNFGNILFDLLIKEYKKYNIKKISIVIDKDNIQMRRIISHKKNFRVIGNINFEIYELFL